MLFIQRFMSRSSAVLIVMILTTALVFAATKDKKSEWKFIGPRMIDTDWIRFDPSNPNCVYSLNTKGLLYNSTDAGMTWHNIILQNEPEKPGDTWAQSRTLPGTIDNITVGGDGTVYLCSGWVYRSRDHGKSWRQLSSVPEVSGVIASIPGVVLKFTIQGLYRSIDSGDTWSMVKSHIPWSSDAVYAVNPKDMRLIFLVTPNIDDGSQGLLRSTDAGATWQRTSSPKSPIAALVSDPTNPKILYSTTADGFYRSDDMGDSWIKTYASDRFWQTSHALAVDLHSPETIYAQTTTGIAISRDGGRKWTNINKEYLRHGYHAAIGASSDTILIAKVSAMWRSANHGSSWSDVSVGFRPMSIKKVVVDYARRGCIYVSSWGSDILRTTDNGKHWYEANIQCDNLITLPSMPGTVMAYSYDHVKISNDGGDTWIERLPNVNHNTYGATFTVDPANIDYMYVACLDGMSVSDNGGLTWTTRKIPLLEPKLDLSAITVSPVDGTMYAGAHGHTFYDTGMGKSNRPDPQTVHLRIFKSADKGKTWDATPASDLTSDTSSKFASDHNQITTLVADPKNANILYAAGPPGLTRCTFFKSKDRGQTWIYRDDSPIRAQVSSIAIDSLNTRRLYISTYEDGLFASKDAGDTWVSINQGLAFESRSPKYEPVFDVTIDPFNHSRLYIALRTGLYTFINN